MAVTVPRESEADSLSAAPDSDGSLRDAAVSESRRVRSLMMIRVHDPAVTSAPAAGISGNLGSCYITLSGVI